MLSIKILFVFLQCALFLAHQTDSRKMVIVTCAHLRNAGFSLDWLKLQHRRIATGMERGDFWRVVWFINFDGISIDSKESNQIIDWIKSMPILTPLLIFNSTKSVTANTGAIASKLVDHSKWPPIILCFSSNELKNLRHPEAPIRDLVHAKFSDFWVYHMDADNIIHCDFLASTAQLVASNKNVGLILMSQRRVEYILELMPWTPKENFIDTAQLLMRISEIQKHKLIWVCNSCANTDGPFIEKAFNALKNDPAKIIVTNQFLSFHNRLLWKQPPIEECVVNNYRGKNSHPKIRDPLLDYSSLYQIYRADLSEATALARKFCSNEAALRAGLPHYRACLTGLVESELLYLRIRFYKPKIVVEVSSALGYSTLWILLALEHNQADGILYSFDVYETPFPSVLDEYLRERWIFIKGDMKNTYAPVASNLDIDYLHIDTCHDEACIKWYLKNVLATAENSRTGVVHVSTHDAYEMYYKSNRNDGDKPAPEGALILEWIAFSCRARLFHTVAPGVSKFIQELVEKRNSILGSVLEKNLIGDWWTSPPYHGDLMSTLYFDLISSSNEIQCKNCEKL
jgi:hypothetical protein